MRTVGVVLAGGASRRMGSDKALALLGGRMLLDRVVGELAAVAEETVVIGRTELPAGIDATAVPDAAGNHVSGPLAGLCTAARCYPDALLLVAACDQALLRRETVAGLAAAAAGREAAAARVAGVVQPLGAAYLAPAVERVCAGGEAGAPADVLVRLDTAVLEEPAWRALGDDGRSWRSLDTTGLLARAEAELAEEASVDAWWARLARAVPGLPVLDPALRADLLGIAKYAADASVRWAAPLSTWAVGVATSGDPAGMRAAAARVRAVLVAGES